MVFVNIGGISNITYVGEGDPIAFDTGPGNALIDQWVAREGGVPFDADGAIASEGGVVRAVVDALSRQAVLCASPGRNRSTAAISRWPRPSGLELADGARTLAAVSAEAILKSVEHLPQPPKLWIVGGGGRKNPHIVGDLRDGAARCRRRGDPRRGCRPARRFHRGRGLGLSGGALAERLAADLSDDDGMQGAGDGRRAGAAWRLKASGRSR